MSNYGREHGSIHFTQSGYAHFVRLFRQKHNDTMREVYRQASALHEQLSRITGTGATERQHHAFDHALQHGGFIVGYHRTASSARLPKVLPLDGELFAQLRSELFRGKSGGLTRPRKGAFRHFTNREVAFSLPCNQRGSLTFRPQQIDWCSTQGNNTWVHAKAGLTWHVFQATLDAYPWKRGEGGQFMCDSEINQADHGYPSRHTIGRR